MDSHDFAKWMREEHHKVDALSRALKEKVSLIPRTGHKVWLEELRSRFEHLRAHMHKHMALEERDGYLPMVTERRPTLSREVDRLKHEHSELSRIMDRIRDELHDLTPDDPLLIEDCCARIDRLLGFVRNHEEHENLLVLSVFDDDLGLND